jgi:hypothetical protein
LQQNVNSSFEKYNAEQNNKVANIYKILNSLLRTIKQDSISANVQSDLKLPSLNIVPNESLHWDTCTTVYEQMFFYGDEDGKVGFNGFMSGFNKANWKVDASNEDWVEITSKNTKTPIVIFANKPLDEPHDEYAQMHLIDYLIEKDIHPSIMVHRGHSYHLKSTIAALNSENKIIILGSCGGYQNLNDIIQRAPGAHIISTKQVGVFKVNTPIINAVNQKIIQNKDVNWVSIWKDLSKQFAGTPENAYFIDYVPPHKNLGSLFLKAYRKLQEEKAENE